MFAMVAAGCCVGGANGGIAGICMALYSLIAAGLGAFLQIVIIAFSWKYAFPAEVSPKIVPAT